ncbi:MAG: hypothetical protein ACF8XB_06530, partial [Planctomycetota bacterium JB042]
VIRDAIRAVVASPSAPPPGFPSLEFGAGQVLAQLTNVPRFEMLRRTMAGHPGADLLEAQVVLTRTMFRLHAGFDDEASFAAAAAGFDAARVGAIAEETLDPSRRRTLTLRPAE